MNPSLRQLKAFLHIARLRSFTRAAEQLHMTQAGLSATLRELERQLDCRLFDRTTRTVALTSAGARLLPVAERAVSEIEATAASIGRSEALARRTLSIAAAPLFAAALLPEACAAFRAIQPDIDVRIRDVDGRRIVDTVENGECDVGFGIFIKPAAGLERRPLFRQELICVLPGRARGRSGPTPRRAIEAMPWAGLRDQSLIGLPADSPFQQLVDQHLAAIGRGNESRPAFNTFHTLLAMVAAGFGAAIVPSYALAAMESLPLRAAILTSPRVRLDLYRLTKKGRPRAPSEAHFVDCLLEVLARRCALD